MIGRRNILVFTSCAFGVAEVIQKKKKISQNPGRSLYNVPNI
jgi:hypothetical protein